MIPALQPVQAFQNIYQRVSQLHARMQAIEQLGSRYQAQPTGTMWQPEAPKAVPFAQQMIQAAQARQKKLEPATGAVAQQTAAPTVPPEQALAAKVTASENPLMGRINAAIETAAEKFEMDPAMLRAVIKQESNFDPWAVSSANARGLMQLMPGTAAELGVSDVFNIEDNVQGGAKYLSRMLERFDGDVDLALAAYNAGPTAVARAGGIPPYSETQAYVPNVMNWYQVYQNQADSTAGNGSRLDVTVD